MVPAGRSRNDVGVAVVFEDLQRVLAYRGTAAPDQDPLMGVLGDVVGGFWPGEGEGEVFGEGVPGGDDVVGECDGGWEGVAFGDLFSN